LGGLGSLINELKRGEKALKKKTRVTNANLSRQISATSGVEGCAQNRGTIWERKRKVYRAGLGGGGGGDSRKKIAQRGSLGKLTQNRVRKKRGRESPLVKKEGHLRTELQSPSGGKCPPAKKGR